MWHQPSPGDWCMLLRWFLFVLSSAYVSRFTSYISAGYIIQQMASVEFWHAIKKESNSNRVFTALANYGSIPGFVENSGTPQEWHSQCVFLERSVWWERMWCSRRLWEERGGELGLGAARTENRIGPLTDLVHWGIKELAALLPTIDTTHPVKHIPPPRRITDKSPCLRSFFLV